MSMIRIDKCPCVPSDFLTTIKICKTSYLGEVIRHEVNSCKSWLKENFKEIERYKERKNLHFASLRKGQLSMEPTSKFHAGQMDLLEIKNKNYFKIPNLEVYFSETRLYISFGSLYTRHNFFSSIKKRSVTILDIIIDLYIQWNHWLCSITNTHYSRRQQLAMP